MDGHPRFSIITPVYETPPGVLCEMLESVHTQSYCDWELCLVDDASKAAHVRDMLNAAAQSEPRIEVRFREENGGIVAASNDALEMARGEFIVLLDHDDELHPDALALVHEALLRSPEADYVYTDEDKIDTAGRHSGPFFKPGWSPERLRTQMYTCHLSVLRRSLVEEVGGFDAEFEGSQDWDLVLRVTERARAVLHVPRVLYHWRMIETSAAGGGEAAKLWAFEAGTRAIEAHCERIGIDARVRRDEADAGVYHLDPRLSAEPPVSVIIPTRGTEREVRYERKVLACHCVRSIVEQTRYSNYEIVLVADDDTPAGAIDELRSIGGDRLMVVPYEAQFNFSTKINLGAVRASGERLLLLNDDMEVTTSDWIDRMVMYTGIHDVGAVGGRLLWQDGRLQHVVVRFQGGLPGHLYRGFAHDFKGYGNSVLVAQNALAVTGACLMSRRDVFDEVGGLSTMLPINYNDIDYCLKLHAAGYRIVYDPDLILYHFESSSRSVEVKNWEKEMLRDRWGPMIAVDPYSNPNLHLGAPRLLSPFAWMKRRWPRLRWQRATPVAG